MKPMSLRLLDCLNEHPPDAPAALNVGRDADARNGLGYGAMAAAVRGLSNRIAGVVAEGDVVLLSTPNDPAFVVSFLAVLAAGAKAFPVSPELTEPELLAAVEAAAPVAAIGTDGLLSSLRGKVRSQIPIRDACAGEGAAAFPRRDVSRGGLLLQSSGTTGLPKIAFRAAASLDAVAAAMVESVGFGVDDRVLLTIPLCHSYGIEHGLLAPILAGSSVHLCHGFDLRGVLKQLAEAGVTMFPGVPFMFELLAQVGAENAHRFPALRRAYSAGGPLPAKVSEAFRQRYGVRVSQLYGATEIGSVLFNDPDDPAFDPASVGRAMRGVDLRILDAGRPDVAKPLPAGSEGQVAVRADSMMGGYLGEEPGAALLDGYFLTGDLGRLDERGRLTLTGRLKLLIDVGGLKVNPLEVEQVLAEHPEVGDCVVVPVKASETVCRLKAIVTPRDPESAGPSAESLRQFARARLTQYKVPRLFEVRKTLPRSATGKILRHMVAA